MLRLLGTGLVFCLALMACDDPFPPRNLVERLRPLAVKATPPECGLADEVELEALVADPAGDGRELRFSWAVCLLELDSAAGDIDCPGGDSYPLPGQGASSRLSLPDLLSWLSEEGFVLEPDRWPTGDEAPEDLPLFIGFEVRAANESVRGLKRIKLRLTDVSGDNGNPRLLGLEIDGVEVGEDPPRIPAGAKVVLAPLVDESSRDVFVPDGESESRLEDFLFSWFCSAGKFEDERSILDVDSEGRRLDTNEYQAPEQPGMVTLWLVVRDTRYGTDWMTWQVEIVKPSPLVE